MRRQPSVFDQAGMECGNELLYIRVQSESEQTNGECQYGPFVVQGLERKWFRCDRTCGTWLFVEPGCWALHTRGVLIPATPCALHPVCTPHPPSATRLFSVYGGDT